MTERGGNEHRWLVFFYSVPSKPVKNRMSVWRRLARAGAVQLKETVYILPFSHEREEFIHWLIEDIASMGGEGAVLVTDTIEPIGNEGIVNLFSETREKEFQAMEKEFSILERKIESIRKGGGKRDTTPLSAQYARLSNSLNEMLKTDFFDSSKGKLIKEQSLRIRRQIDLADADKGSERAESIRKRRTGDYRKRIWATRKRPFVDRMASAWLVKKFIDPDAEFRFVNERKASGTDPAVILFDIKGGEFTHVGDLCTFEVMVKSFNLRDRALGTIAEVVHELDIKDSKYPHPEAKGIEDILTGIRKTTKDDLDTLSKGVEVFEMLYQSLK